MRTRAKILDGLCQRYHCLPSSLLEEDAHLIFSMMQVLANEEKPETINPGVPDTGLMADMGSYSTVGNYG